MDKVEFVFFDPERPMRDRPRERRARTNQEHKVSLATRPKWQELADLIGTSEQASRLETQAVWMFWWLLWMGQRRGRDLVGIRTADTRRSHHGRERHWGICRP